MSAETFAALVGAALGATVTLIITLLGRWWIFRDARAAGRRAYVGAATKRMLHLVKTATQEELTDINDETFEVGAMALHIPRWETPVHLWYVFREAQLFRDAVAKVKAGKFSDNQVQLFGEALDVQQELTGWARGQWSRSAFWFWWQLRTTDRVQWLAGREAGKTEDMRIVAARRARAVEARATIRQRRGASEGVD